jgi:putative effector of murein hydrolase
MKKKYFILFLFSVVLFVLLRFPYRHYIYSNEVFDYYIADTSPNFIVLLIYVFYYKWRSSIKESSLFLILGGLIGLIFYEVIIQPLTSIQRLDEKDIIASILGSIICSIICIKVEDQKLLDFLKL